MFIVCVCAQIPLDAENVSMKTGKRGGMTSWSMRLACLVPVPVQVSKYVCMYVCKMYIYKCICMEVWKYECMYPPVLVSFNDPVSGRLPAKYFFLSCYVAVTCTYVMFVCMYAYM